MNCKLLIALMGIMLSAVANAQDTLPKIALNLDLSSMEFDKSNLNIYESSSYYPGVRSNAGHELYTKEFPTHNIIRANFFDWAVVLADNCVPDADYANCIEKFKGALETSRDYLKSLITQNKTKILVVDIFRVPNWLSVHPDPAVACGGGNLGQSYRPKDYTVWQKMLAVTSNLVKELEKEQNAPQIFYQFWNEPELACNWQEGTAEFLQLYSQTMPYLKSIHPGAKVGGASLEKWDGKITKDGSTRPHNLNFDLMMFTQEHNLPMDFVDFHYFSDHYKEYFLDGMAQYRAYQEKLGISEAQMPIYLSEWLPQEGNPNGYSSLQAVDAANLFVAMHQAKLWGQGGVPFQDYGTNPDDQWGTVTFPDADKKPIFYVYKFFDEISRTSLGIHYQSDDITLDIGGQNTKIGERKYIISKISDSCYKMSNWNRVASAPEAAISYLVQQGISVGELRAAYGQENSVMLSKMLAAIKSNQPFDTKYAGAFANANKIYGMVEQVNASNEFSYDIAFAGASGFERANALSSGRDGMETKLKTIETNGNHLQFALRPSEILFSEICLR